MKRSILFLPILLILIASLSSCEAIEGIFKAGVWTGIFIVAIIIAVIIFIARSLGGKK